MSAGFPERNSSGRIRKAYVIPVIKQLFRQINHAAKTTALFLLIYFSLSPAAAFTASIS